MPLNDASLPNSTQQIYSPKCESGLCLIGLGVFIALLGGGCLAQAAGLSVPGVSVFLASLRPENVVGDWLIVLIGVSGVVAGYLNLGTRLVVSAKSIFYITRTTVRVYAWSAVVQLREEAHYHREKTVEVLLVMDDGWKLSLSLFLEYWPDHQLSQQLRLYAPWLFAEGADAGAKARPVRR